MGSRGSYTQINNGLQSSQYRFYRLRIHTEWSWARGSYTEIGNGLQSGQYRFCRLRIRRVVMG